LKARLRDMEEEEKGGKGSEAAGDLWRLLVRMLQRVWDTGEIPHQMLLTVVVLIPKGGGDYRGIGLLEVTWKVIEKILVSRLQSIPLHNALHGFRQKRGCGTGIMEAKLLQQLAFLEQCPLYGVFLDLRKAYDAMDRDRCLKILEDNGVSAKTSRLIRHFWDKATLVCKASDCYGALFKAW
jgi:hypothetical protein